ncbi:tRNA (adenosine(37)-N6)-threonylcarbamoyltransferase complex transferase subunit TsaD [Synechococcus sp. M16CYN]|uniref:tRNA (adenosine(37)-N6)-threonylcarbamoyltransferase complex transferase subunit TsaD n=1 Tax=Synechococcus sp. M16CYN TaxID=3103139 RepID=UPI003251A66C
MHSVLALETSCDESAAAVVRSTANGDIEVLASQIASQVQEHALWGGVVPEIASRLHVEAMPFLVNAVLRESALPIHELDAIAATVTPGLVGALMVASVTGRTLAALHQISFLGIHHLEGHLASVYLGNYSPSPPYLVLLVSGGHTELIRVGPHGLMERLGRSHDDAVGEAFDKVARLLGLGYPGGPAIQAKATEGDPKRFSLPKGKISMPSGGFHPYDFSFSGLKTAMLRIVNGLRASGGALPLADLAASFERVVAEVLVEHSFRCAMDHNLNHLVMVGGVAANRRLRQLMKRQGEILGVTVSMAPLKYCTDNAAMIGAAALGRLQRGVLATSCETGVAARWQLERADALYESLPAF